jgi:hypothetical protein
MHLLLIDGNVNYFTMKKTLKIAFWKYVGLCGQGH